MLKLLIEKDKTDIGSEIAEKLVKSITFAAVDRRENEKYIVYTDIDTPVDVMSYVERAIVKGVEYSLDESLDGVAVRDRIKLMGDVDYKTPGTYQVDIKLSYTIDDSLDVESNSCTVPFIIVVR